MNQPMSICHEEPQSKRPRTQDLPSSFYDPVRCRAIHEDVDPQPSSNALTPRPALGDCPRQMTRYRSSCPSPPVSIPRLPIPQNSRKDIHKTYDPESPVEEFSQSALRRKYKDLRSRTEDPCNMILAVPALAHYLSSRKWDNTNTLFCQSTATGKCRLEIQTSTISLKVDFEGKVLDELKANAWRDTLDGTIQLPKPRYDMEGWMDKPVTFKYF